MNEYRILYRSLRFDHIARVFIYANNHNEANETVMDTYEVPRHFIVSNSLWKKDVAVNVTEFENGRNIVPALGGA